MQLEIERKYHLRYFPEVERGGQPADNTTNYADAKPLIVQAVQQIDQTYLALGANEEIRIRKIVDEHTSEVKYTHTFKKGLGLSREEIDYEISGEIYEQLLAMSGAVPLRKTRTIVTDGQTVYEIDSYEQFSLEVVEVEFSSEQEATAFQPPAWFGEEIQPGEEKSNKKMWKDLQGKRS